MDVWFDGQIVYSKIEHLTNIDEIFLRRASSKKVRLNQTSQITPLFFTIQCPCILSNTAGDVKVFLYLWVITGWAWIFILWVLSACCLSALLVNSFYIVKQMIWCLIFTWGIMTHQANFYTWEKKYQILYPYDAKFL